MGLKAYELQCHDHKAEAIDMVSLTWDAGCKYRRGGLHSCVLCHSPLKDISFWRESKDDCDRGASLRAARGVGRRDRYGTGLGDVAHLSLAYELRRHLL